jgi:hypothetical protein
MNTPKTEQTSDEIRESVGVAEDAAAAPAACLCCGFREGNGHHPECKWFSKDNFGLPAAIAAATKKEPQATDLQNEVDEQARTVLALMVQNCALTKRAEAAEKQCDRLLAALREYIRDTLGENSKSGRTLAAVIAAAEQEQK